MSPVAWVLAAGPVPTAVPSLAAAGPPIGIGSLATLAQSRGRGLRRGAKTEDLRTLCGRLRDEGAGTVLVLDAAIGNRRCHWLDSAHASGWIEVPPATGPAVNPHAVATALARALAAGHVGADAALLALSAVAGGSRLAWDDPPRFGPPPAAEGRPLGLYAIVDSPDRLQQVLAAGVRTAQLRIKAPAGPGGDWTASLRRDVERSVALAKAAGAELFVNDHWELARELGADGVHLGQEDLAALGPDRRAELTGSGLALGVSTHSIWELARALSLGPRYVACGPVWPTRVKALDWVPQGEDNLGWWCRHSGCPVVAIGGVLGPAEVERAAACGADGVCVLSGLGPDPGTTVPQLHAALERGRRAAGNAVVPEWPHPTLAL